MKRLWKNIRSYTIFLASVSLVYVLVLSCETVPEADPNPGGNNNPDPVENPGGSSTFEGCQYMWNDTMMLRWNDTMMVVGSFRSVNASQLVYQVFGFSFSVDFTGNIKEMGIRVPEEGTYTVRIYDADLFNNDILAETEITVAGQDWNFVSIDPLAVDPDHIYMACVYFASKPDNGEANEETLFYHLPEFNYPLKLGDLTIEGYAVNGAIDEKVKPEPKDPSFNIFNGLVDICFEAD